MLRASRSRLLFPVIAAAVPLAVFLTPAPNPPLLVGPDRIIAWNDLGMHCGDPDFSVFAVLPPYNTVNAQVIRNNQLVTGASVDVTYEGAIDPTGSINTTSIGKTNFWDHVQALFGVSLAPDVGLTGRRMPGLANVPQPMSFVGAWNWFTGDGIPFTPTDDAGHKNAYPLMRITARDGGGNAIASTVTTIPNSQELECSLCHASGASPFAMPAGGWVFDADPVRDDRLNILRLHDRHLGESVYQSALQTAGYNQAGLYVTATADGNAVLCARCHASNALPGTGIAGITPLTEAIHGLHGGVVDQTATRLDDNPTRTACYSCHPGFDTQCARGAMAKAIGADGKFAMHCQSCHGDLSAVGTTGRVGWLDQPACQNCHTGTATTNSGAIRFTSVFDANGNRRTPASTVFATDPDTPAPGFSLYRFSDGHGGLQCSACHGSPHAIYPTSLANDNLQSLQLQGHVGTITECSVCHDQRQDNQLIGPHGMHPANADWANGKHADVAEQQGLAQCRSCHGSDYRGTVLSLAQGDRTFSTRFGTKTFWRGFRVSCYACHNGPNSSNANGNRAPVVADRNETTPNDVPLVFSVSGTDADNDALTFRIVSQPMRGRVGLQGTTVTYFPMGYTGTVSFTYAAWDGDTDSNLGTVSVTVTPASCSGTIEPYGFGCPGSGGFMPVLSVSGCPTPGGSLTFDIRNGYGGSGGVLLIGAAPATQMLFDGCVLRVAPIVAATGAINFGGSGAGNGTGSLTLGIPPTVTPGDLAVQAVLYDPGINRLWSLSNGVAMTIR